MNIIQELDRLYKEWCGSSHLENSNRMVHDSAETQDFARFCIEELKILNGETLVSNKEFCDHPESARMHMIDEDDECTICGEKFG